MQFAPGLADELLDVAFAQSDPLPELLPQFRVSIDEGQHEVRQFRLALASDEPFDLHVPIRPRPARRPATFPVGRLGRRLVLVTIFAFAELLPVIFLPGQ